MGERLSRALPVLVGVVAPLALLVTNMVWNYGTILLTILALVWLGFAVVLLAPPASS
ncbi:MAG: hypothetical protein HY557_03315 [Euryarchaeota archaeon]|nr:hypothetical protein [Euryarchaeota archaeon]